MNIATKVGDARYEVGNNLAGVGNTDVGVDHISRKDKIFLIVHYENIKLAILVEVFDLNHIHLGAHRSRQILPVAEEAITFVEKHKDTISIPGRNRKEGTHFNDVIIAIIIHILNFHLRTEGRVPEHSQAYFRLRGKIAITIIDKEEVLGGSLP